MNDLGWKVLYCYCYPIWLIANWVRRLVRKSQRKKRQKLVEQNSAFLDYCKRAGISPYDHLEEFFSAPDQWLLEHNINS